MKHSMNQLSIQMLLWSSIGFYFVVYALMLLLFCYLCQEELGAVKMALGDYFSEGAGRSAEVTSLYFHLSRAW